VFNPQDQDMLENRIVMANVFPQLNKNIHRGKLGSVTEKTVGKPSVKSKCGFFIAWSRKRNLF
jgi:hypothetical protein